MINFGHGVFLGRIEADHLEELKEQRNSFDIRRWCRQKDLIASESQELWFDRQMSDPSIEMYSV